MAMFMGNSGLLFLLHTLFWLLLGCSNTCYGVETDLNCLRVLKTELKDPNGYLDSWNLENTTEGAICTFNGVECWHPDESKVLNLRISNMGLQGHFPMALKNCTSMTGLDLSSNELSGSLPTDIDRIIPLLTVLDLSSNNFSGEIPSKIGNLTFLNALSLQHNRFTGQIPGELTQLARLNKLSVEDNSLSGQIPTFQRNFPASNFLGNNGLCGHPLEQCTGPPKKSHTGVIVGAAIGGIIFTIIVMAIAMLFGFCRVSVHDDDDSVEEHKWAKSIKGTKRIKVSLFEKSVPKMRLFNLMKATNNFSRNNIIGSGSTGTMYKALLADGSLLAVKRLQESYHSDDHFVSEMTALASIRHCNLVPLLGFCVARKERLLIFKYMHKGTLSKLLHQENSEAQFLNWALRLRISIGVARGIAWLHHHCNPCIIHRNISSKCVLLDEDYEPKLSDFGFARLMNQDCSHLTLSFDCYYDDSAYVPPEYPHTLVATLKGDVYSFGMVLLELITGKTPPEITRAVLNFEDNMVEWITYLFNMYAKDESLNGRWCDGDILKFLRVASACVVSVPEKRPTMLEVYQLLKAIGARYDFAEEENEEETLVPCENSNVLDELIVAKAMPGIQHWEVNEEMINS